MNINVEAMPVFVWLNKLKVLIQTVLVLLIHLSTPILCGGQCFSSYGLLFSFSFYFVMTFSF